MNAIIKINKNTRSIKIDKPNICPHCQKGIDPKIIKIIEFKEEVFFSEK